MSILNLTIMQINHFKQSIPYNECVPGRPPLTDPPKSGARLAALRNAANLSQTQLAEAIGVPARSISFYERKAQSIPSHLVARLAKALEVSAEELLGLEDQKPKAKRGPKSEIEKRLEQIRKLPRGAQKRILDVVDAMLAQEETRVP